MKKTYGFLQGRLPGVAVMIFAALIALVFLRPTIVDTYENIAYAIDPSPTLAFAYGLRHFDASDPSEYDIKRAEYFFQLVALKDPTIPYLYHELARISFLQGNFQIALAQIDFQIDMHGDSEPNAYYVKGLIEGFMGDYTDSAADYEHYLQFDPRDWAAINDYAWILLKAGRAHDAVVATSYGLKYFPNNPWLLNTNSISLYEVGLIGPARDQAQAAFVASKGITQAQWLRAYPGNDPKIATQGIAAFESAVSANMHTIALASATSTVQSTISHD